MRAPYCRKFLLRRSVTRAGWRNVKGGAIGDDPVLDQLVVESWNYLPAAVRSEARLLRPLSGSDLGDQPVAKGMDADLVVLDADPAKDPTAYAQVRATIRGGRVI